MTTTSRPTSSTAHRALALLTCSATAGVAMLVTAGPLGALRALPAMGAWALRNAIPRPRRAPPRRPG